MEREADQSQAEKRNPEINEPNVEKIPSLPSPVVVEGQVENVEDLAEHKIQPRRPTAADALPQKNLAILTVAVLILTLAYQAAVSPPGGVSQDNKTSHSAAGHVVIGYTHPNSYMFLVLSNAAALSLALVSIFLVACGWTSKTRVLFRAAWGSVCASLIVVAANYAVSVIVTAPRKSESFMLAVLLCIFLPAGVVFVFLILVLIYYFEENLFPRLRRLFGAGTEAEAFVTEANDDERARNV